MAALLNLCVVKISSDLNKNAQHIFNGTKYSNVIDKWFDLREKNCFKSLIASNVNSRFIIHHV